MRKLILMKETTMRIVLSALIAGVLAGCGTAPVNEVEYAAMWNTIPNVWPPVVPGQAFPPQIMDGRD